MILDQVAALIRFLRHSYGLTQEALCERAAIDYRHFQKIESGNVSLKLETLVRLVEAIGVNVRDFFHLLESTDFNIFEDKSQLPPPESGIILLGVLLQSSKYRYSPQAVQSILNIAPEFSAKQKLKENSNTPFLKCDFNGKIQWMNLTGKARLEDLNIFQDGIIPDLDLSGFQCYSWRSQFFSLNLAYKSFQLQVHKCAPEMNLLLWGPNRSQTSVMLACSLEIIQGNEVTLIK